LELIFTTASGYCLHIFIKPSTLHLFRRTPGVYFLIETPVPRKNDKKAKYEKSATSSGMAEKLILKSTDITEPLLRFLRKSSFPS
jgi:hypothetical protein